MNYVTESIQDIIVFHINNRFDSYNCYNIEESLDTEIKKGTKKILFSLKDVSYISSSGFRLLVSTLNEIKAVDGKLKISSLPEDIEKVFHDIKLDQIFEIYNTDEEALSSFSRK